MSPIQQAVLTPPRKFVPAGFVTWAQFAPDEPDYIKTNKKRVTGARAAGLRYEAKAKIMLQRTIPEADSNNSNQLLVGPWLMFKAGNDKIRYCQPDALLIDLENKRVVIYEIKLQHTSQAWWQVRKLYQPVLERIYTNYSFVCVEVVKWLDAHAAFPETFYYAESPMDLTDGKFGVHIYDGRR